ncbi:hypothetical protein BH11PSE9_BH11PSE9_23660 [soil metagenome]
MNATVLQRDAFMPRQPRGLGLGLVLALIAHVLLVIALAIGVNWRSHEPQGVEAELWSATPQAAAPRAVEPEPQPTPPAPKPPQPEPRRPEPAPEPKPAPVQQPVPDPQIAIEKAKREQAKKEQLREEQEEREQAKKEQAKRDKAEQLKKEQAKQDKAKREEAKREESERAKEAQDRKQQLAEKEKERADAAKLAAAREANLKRMMGQAGATGGPTATGTAARSSGPSPGYAGRIAALVKRNIAYQLQSGSAPVATVEVRVASDGTIIGMRLTKSSGDKLYDDAVLRAIDKTGTFPRDTNGTIPSPMELNFRATD